jgi:hypothetical protein
MDWVILIGSLCLGTLIGALVGWYVNEATQMSDRILASSVSALVGSSVLAMFSFLAGLRGPTREYWFYPVGLLIGFATITIIEVAYFGYDGKKRARKGSKVKQS